MACTILAMKIKPVFRKLAVAAAAVIILLTTVSCATNSVQKAAADGDVIYLNLTWHQHQPLYYTDPDSGDITRPWVRVHATKDYYDMVSILEEYPEVRLTVNLTPVLLRQIDAYLDGAKDVYWTLSEKPAGSLTDDEKRFILERFFDANWNNMIRKYPRYGQLLALRGDGSPESVERSLISFTEQDYRDLQVWFNLAWFDPDFLNSPPLNLLVDKGRDFNEEDKTIIFEKTLEIMAAIIPEHKKLQDAGQIEVITTPYAHPILPLLYNSDLGAKGDPSSDMPGRFSYPNDAISQLRISADRYREDFGREPAGLWPAEGSVGQDVVRIISEAGFTWMASGEQVLAKSLGIPGFTRSSKDVVEQADQLYRPYLVSDEKSGASAYIVFRDHRISDLVGFEYSGTPPEQAAQDFIDRIEAIRLKLKQEGSPGPHLVSVILDGENAWEHYPEDGKEFLHALYRKLSESETIVTATVSDYTAEYPDQRRIEELWWGSWFSPDYATWIGEEEENIAWEYLRRTREMLAKYDIAGRKQASPEALEAALDAMYLAEGSDWFWWYGDDQDSGVDRYFDEAFRALLSQVYRELGEDLPSFLSVPIIPDQPAAPVRGPQGIVTPLIDGKAGAAEWADAGYFSQSGGTMARAEDVLEKISYGWDKDNLSFTAASRTDWETLPDTLKFSLYFSLPGQEYSISLIGDGSSQEYLGFGAGYKLEISAGIDGIEMELFNAGIYGTWQRIGPVGKAAAVGRTLEFSLPFKELAATQPGDQLYFRVYLTRGETALSRLPADGPAREVLPDLMDSAPILFFTDAVGDDYGPGTYTYPTDAVFADGVFDITSLKLAENEEFYIFTLGINAAVSNPWGSGLGLSLQTFDIYIDVDPGKGTGRRELLEGRNARLEEGSGWEYAVWAEGWNQKLIMGYDDQSLAEVSGTPVRTLVDSDNGTVTLLVRRESLDEAGPAGEWGIAAALLSQEGYPSPGVRRVRDVQPSASQWRFGGASDPVSATRIIDLAVPEESGWRQEDALLNGIIPLIPVK